MSDTSTDTTPAFQLLFRADCLDILRGMADGTVHAVVCDPPYELGFMGKSWDSTGIAYRVDLWREVLRVLKPGGYCLAFGGSRTYHRMACAIEDAGFDLRDCCMWVAGSGFPKSLDVSKAIEKAAGVQPLARVSAGGVGLMTKATGKGGRSYKREDGGWNETKTRLVMPPLATDAAKKWKGWGTALKPAFEPIVVARKPLEGTVAANVLKHGTGAMNIDASRVPTTDNLNGGAYSGGVRPMSAMGLTGEAGGTSSMLEAGGGRLNPEDFKQPEGRWPANILLSHDVNCSDEDGCVSGCPCALMDEQSGTSSSAKGTQKFKRAETTSWKERGGSFTPGREWEAEGYGDTGGASRFFNNLPIEEDDYPPFFYAAKASRKEREAGCDDIPPRPPPAAELKVSLKSPRAGAGRTAESVRNGHPCVKPVSVMSWLVNLVTPPGGIVMDPFMGSGTTGIAAVKSGFNFIGCEQSEEYMAIAEARIRHHGGDPEVVYAPNTETDTDKETAS